jgi:hypothetical protein
MLRWKLWLPVLALMWLVQAQDISEQTCTVDGTCQTSEEEEDAPSKKKIDCEDNDYKCQALADGGECTTNPGCKSICGFVAF